MEPWDSGENTLAKSNASQILWEGEDEEDDVKDSWDMEPEPEPVKEEKPPPKKSKKKIGEKFDKKVDSDEDLSEPKELTPEEQLAEKLRRQRLQEESDLCLAKEIFGAIPASGSSLESQDEYEKLKEDILKVVANADKTNANYSTFVEELIHGLCVHLSSTELKKIHTWLGNLHIEKTKMEKGDKSKKSKAKGKAKLKFEDDHSLTTKFSGYDDDYDDFI